MIVEDVDFTAHCMMFAKYFHRVFYAENLRWENPSPGSYLFPVFLIDKAEFENV